LGRVHGRLRLVEGLALPREKTELLLSRYKSAVYWIEIDQPFAIFGLPRNDLTRKEKGPNTVRTLAPRMATNITLAAVKKR